VQEIPENLLDIFLLYSSCKVNTFYLLIPYKQYIIFVYLTDESSPKELWEKTIQDISGEHYYLTKEESESISKSKQYGFDAVPTYMFFDSNGNLKNKISGYPGNDAMQKMIEELLQ